MHRYPLLCQINTRAYLTRIGERLGRRATLDDVPDDELDALAARGFDWVWFLSVWQLGDAGRRIARTDGAWLSAARAALPDLHEDDIESSGFAIVTYRVAPELGGPEALARARSRLAARGLKLMLDFVPNHTALDCAWAYDHPDYFVTGTSAALLAKPQNYVLQQTARGPMIFAHGRDPNADGWSDTLQLDYANPRLQSAQRAELIEIASQCEGVRCDMAMLLLPDVFARTWGLRPQPFWPSAIAEVRARFPNFTFLAEAYWDREAELQSDGFDYAYDKRLYDRLRERQAGPVRDHLGFASLSYQSKLARFLENHDEPRAAAVFAQPVHEAAAIVTYLSPGLRFFQDGQCEGARVRLPTQLVRAPDEPLDGALQSFYQRLLATLQQSAFHAGEWQFVGAQAAWEGNRTHDNIVAFRWGARALVVVNYSDAQAQCYLPLPLDELRDRRLILKDLMGSERYERDGNDLLARGVYVDLAPWRYNVFSLRVT